jgi:hypothetical protein
MGDADRSVLQALKEQVLTQGMRQIREECAQAFRGAPQRARELESEIHAVQGQVDRLVDALASGKESPAIAKAIREREGHLDTLRASLAQARALLDLRDPADPDHDRVSESRLAATKQGLLWAMSLKNPRADKSRARGALRALVPGRIVFRRAPDGSWTFEGKANGRALLEPVTRENSGENSGCKSIASPGVPAMPRWPRNQVAIWLRQIRSREAI